MVFLFWHSGPIVYLSIRDWQEVMALSERDFLSTAFAFALPTATAIVLIFCPVDKEHYHYTPEIEYYLHTLNCKVLTQGIYKAFHNNVSLDVTVEDSAHSVLTKSIYFKPEIKTDCADFIVDFYRGVVYIPYGKEKTLKWNV